MHNDVHPAKEYRNNRDGHKGFLVPIMLPVNKDWYCMKGKHSAADVWKAFRVQDDICICSVGRKRSDYSRAPLETWHTIMCSNIKQQRVWNHLRSRYLGALMWRFLCWRSACDTPALLLEALSTSTSPLLLLPPSCPCVNSRSKNRRVELHPLRWLSRCSFTLPLH